MSWATLLHTATQRIAERVLNLLYPGICAICSRLCDDGGPLCGQCHQMLVMQETSPACEKCARPIASHGGRCPWCLDKGIYPYQGILRLGLFEDPLRKLVHHMKYHHRWPIAEILAMDLFARHPGVGHGSGCASGAKPVFVPVPLHFRRHFLRGYNQSELIARMLAHKGGATFVRAVARVRPTTSQTRLRSRQARKDNVKGAFALTIPEAVAGRHVIVIDDVMTTGATLQEVGRELRKAAPASLRAIVIAVADPRGRAFQAI